MHWHLADHYILNARGEAEPATDLGAWSRWYDAADRTVCVTWIGPSRVSTVFLALNHNFTPGGAPLLWETMVFGGPLDGETRRYATRRQAEQGHVALCVRVRLEEGLTRLLP